VWAKDFGLGVLSPRLGTLGLPRVEALDMQHHEVTGTHRRLNYVANSHIWCGV
jgi:hypothetical protein